VSTAWIVLVWLIKYVVINYYKKGVYAPDRQLDDIFEGGKTVPHENTYIRKTNQIKTLEITEI